MNDIASMKLTYHRRCTVQKKGDYPISQWPLTEHITPALLAKLDDVAIDLVIDNVRIFHPLNTARTCAERRFDKITFPGITRKSCVEYYPLQHVDKGAVSKILSGGVPLGIKGAQHKLLQMSCVADYRGSNQKPTAQSEWFYRQLRSYVQIYRQKCPFRIAESEYLTDHEAAVFAKNDFQGGETIRFLSGVCVPLTTEEELQLEISGKDFSILQSSPDQPAAMFLGPARFVNHDCKPNSEIVRSTPSRARIVALKNIKENDEITVFYGKDYFGDNNHECLCRTCTTRVARP